METKKRRTSTEVYFNSQYSPEQIWEFLVHPKYTEEFAMEKCYYLQIPEDFSLEKGKTYLEIHNGEGCNGEICEYKILKIIPHKLFQRVKHQIGLKEVTTYILAKNDLTNTTLITEIHRYSISFKGFKMKHLLFWALLHLGLITKFVNFENDRKWFENMEKKISESF